MVTERCIAYLNNKYGEHEYNYPLLSDYNVWTVVQKCETYEEFDRRCKGLNETVREIKEMQEKMK